MRTNILVTRVAVRWAGNLPSSEWVAARLRMVAELTEPSFRMLETPWYWVWRVAPEHHDQVAEAAPDNVLIALGERDNIHPDIPGDRFLVARIDSDDAFAPDALDRIAAADLKPGTLVNFPRGWQWDRREGRVGVLIFPLEHQGPFVAVTQEGRDMMLHAGGHHGKVRKGRKLVTMGAPSWLQVIHEDNARNRWRRGRPAPLAVLDRFGIRP